MKIENKSVINSVCVHKFIETPDRFYINTASYDKNFSKIQSDNIGIAISNIAQSGANGYNFSNGTANYNGAQNKNMIAHTVVQLHREQYEKRSGVVNGVIRDSKYNHIYYLITGTDKAQQFVSVNELTGETRLLRLFEYYVPDNDENRYSFNKRTSSYTEILTQTDEYIYVLAPSRFYSGNGVYNYSWQRGSLIAKIRKSSVLSQITLEERVLCCEVDTNLYGEHRNAYCEGRAYKIYEDENKCIILSSTVSSTIVLLTIDKLTNKIAKTLLTDSANTVARNPVFACESFVRENMLYTYCIIDGKLFLVSINLNKIDDLSRQNITFTECKIDLSFIQHCFTGDRDSATVHLVLNELNDDVYATLFVVREGTTNTILKDKLISFEISSDLTEFTEIYRELQEMQRSDSNVIKIDKDRILVINNCGVQLYAFNKNFKHYKMVQNFPIARIAFVAKTIEGRIFIQDKSDIIEEISLKSNIEIDLKFRKGIYSTNDKDTTLSITITNELGDFIDNMELHINLCGCTFDDGTSNQKIFIPNGKSEVPIKIKNSKMIKANVLDFRRLINENIR